MADTTMKLPFPLDKPSDDEYAVDASAVGYDDGSVADKLGKFVAIPAGSSWEYSLNPKKTYTYNGAIVSPMMGYIGSQPVVVFKFNSNNSYILYNATVLGGGKYTLDFVGIKTSAELPSWATSFGDVKNDGTPYNRQDGAWVNALTPTTIAPEYSETAIYAVDARVTYQGKMYKCTTAITTAEAWTASHWSEVDVDSYLTEFAQKLIDWSLCKQYTGLINTSAFDYTKTSCNFRIIPVNGAHTISINVGTPPLMFVLNDFEEGVNEPSFAEGYSERISDKNFTTPADTKYIAYQDIYYTTIDKTPKKLLIDGYDIMMGVMAEIGENANNIQSLQTLASERIYLVNPYHKNVAITLSDGVLTIPNELWNVHNLENKWTSIQVDTKAEFTLSSQLVIVIDATTKTYVSRAINTLLSTDIVLLACNSYGEPTSGVIYDLLNAHEIATQDSRLGKVEEAIRRYDECNVYLYNLKPDNTFGSSSSTENGSFHLIPVSAGDKVQLARSGYVRYFVLNSFNESNINPPQFATGFGGVQESKDELTMPSGAGYLAVADYYYTNLRTPDKLFINGRNIMETMENISDKVETLETEVDDIIAKNELPSYYDTHYASKLASARDKIIASTDGDNFIFFTDSHVSALYNTDILLKSLVADLGVKKVIFGGDAVKSDIDSQSEVAESWFKALGMSAQVPKSGGKIYPVRGNHDMQTTNSSFAVTDKCTRQMILNGLQNVAIKEDDSCNYYMDDATSKIRYIFIDLYTSHATALSTDIENANGWLKESILSAEEGWEIIVVTHQGLTTDLNVSTEVAITQSLFDTINSAKEKSGDMASTKASILMVLSGHNHRDGETFKGGILGVTSTSVHTPLWDLYKSDKTMTANTVTETAVDVFLYDRTNKVMEIVRFGRGYDRKYNINENVVAVGSTLTLTSSLSSITSWQIWDVEGTAVTSYDKWNEAVVSNNYATISDGVVSGISAGYAVAVASDDTNKKREFFCIKVG